mmetsp:Transcript_95680/g.270807  ORF Transcript_95680/g.270807 Transcript_95680/m.270807 type:complete len:310 (-) Transcript_95680:1022-1951(-)
MVQQVCLDLRFCAPLVVLERLPVQFVPLRGNPLVEKHVGLGPLYVLRAHHADLQVVELVPLLRLLLVLAVRDVVAAAHRADVLDQPDEPVLHGLGRGLVEEGRHLQGPGHGERHHPGVLRAVEPARAGVVPEPLDVDAQYLRQDLEGDPLLAVVLPLAVLAVVLVLPAQELRGAVLAQAVGDLHAPVVEPALHLPGDAAQHARPRRAPHPGHALLRAHGRLAAAGPPLAARHLVRARDRDGDVVDHLLRPRRLLALEAAHHGNHAPLEELRNDGGEVCLRDVIVLVLLVLPMGRRGRCRSIALRGPRRV